MTKDQVYEIWRPAKSPWSRWVKPVLFSFLGEQELGAPAILPRRWEIGTTNHLAAVADLPGAEGIEIGLALSLTGFRPVPVYNASPTSAIPDSTPGPEQAEPVVDLYPIMRALCGSAEALATANLTAASPPAFLLDANRQGRNSGFRTDRPYFLNRSFCAEWDFPSASLLREHGISTIVLIQSAGRIEPDLRDVLQIWQNSGLTIARQEPWQPWNPSPILVRPPNFVVRVWERVKRHLVYSRDPSGAFGHVICHGG
jgi:hypothetical protein